MACEKVRYETSGAATSAITTLKKRSRRSKIPTRSYFCVDCKGYHLTSKPDSDKNKRYAKKSNFKLKKRNGNK